MNDKEFYEKTKKIEDFFEKQLNDVQLNAWNKALKGLNNIQYDYLIDSIFNEFTYMPKIAQVLELKNQIFSQTKKTDDNKIEYVKCSRCKSSGIIRYRRKINEIVYDYFARCSCANGNLYKSLPLIDDVIAKEKEKQNKKSIQITTDKIKNEINSKTKIDIKNYLNNIGIVVNEK